MRLPSIQCECGKWVDSDEFVPNARGGASKATGFDSCHRRCRECGIGYSNTQGDPVPIYREPELCVPEPVRAGVALTLENALNKLNRPSKSVKFCSANSEDAVTWTVFQAISGVKRRSAVVHSALGEVPNGEVRMLLWGVEQPPLDIVQSELRKAIVSVLTKLGESTEAFTEPDVALSSDVGLVIIEAKYRNGNEYDKLNQKPWKKYLNSPAFCEPDRILKSGLYELARNWRLAWELGHPNRFGLAVLAQPTLFRDDQLPLDEFEKGLNLTDGGRFIRWNWADVVSVVAEQPAWFRSYLAERKP